MNDEIEIKLSILDAMLIWGLLDEHNLDQKCSHQLQQTSHR